MAAALALAGLKTPAEVEKQKKEFLKLLDQQLVQGKKTYDTKLQSETAIAKAKAEQQKKNYCLTIDMETQRAENMMKQRAEEEKMQLQQAYALQKAQIEQQSMQAVAEYEKAKAAEEIEKSALAMTNKAEEMQKKFDAELSKMSETGPSRSSAPQALFAPERIEPPVLQGADLQKLEMVRNQQPGLQLKDGFGLLQIPIQMMSGGVRITSPTAARSSVVKAA